MHGMKGYGRLIEEAREAAGLSQAELADRVNLSPSMVSKLEAEKVAISPAVFRRLTSELRALRPAELATAIGYEVTTIGADRLPRGLVQALLEMSPEELDALATLVQRRALTTHLPEERT